jgi:hypothetical protein
MKTNKSNDEVLNVRWKFQKCFRENWWFHILTAALLLVAGCCVCKEGVLFVGSIFLFLMLQSEPEVSSSGFIDRASQKWQYVLDRLSPRHTVRWIMMAVAFSLYCVRVYLVNGWFIVTYGLGIYLLNQLIGFLSPQVNFSSLLANSLTSRYVVRSWGDWQWYESSDKRKRGISVIYSQYYILIKCLPF